MATTIIMFRGDSKEIVFKAEGINLTGKTVFFRAGTSAFDSPLIVKDSTVSTEIEITNALQGEGKVKLLPLDTSESEFPVLNYDIECKDNSTGAITTFQSGRLEIKLVV